MQTVILGDCRQVMAQFPQDSFHLIVTSPPYNVGVNYSDWDDDLSLKDYLSFSREWLSQAYRMLVKGGRLCLNLPLFHYRKRTNLVYEYQAILRDIGFLDREMIAWVKRRNSDGDICCQQRLLGSVASPYTPRIRGGAEIILVMSKSSHSLLGHGSDITEDEYAAWTRNVWEFDTESDRRHPAPFPCELPRRLIKLYSYPGNRVLDPFVGRGTTLRVCRELGRRGVGIELSPSYLPLIQEMVGRRLEVRNSHRPGRCVA